MHGCWGLRQALAEHDAIHRLDKYNTHRPMKIVWLHKFQCLDFDSGPTRNWMRHTRGKCISNGLYMCHERHVWFFSLTRFNSVQPLILSLLLMLVPELLIQVCRPLTLNSWFNYHSCVIFSWLLSGVLWNPFS
jgi:hypothetical protein